MLKYLIAGFTLNFFTSIDDALTNVPVLSASTRTGVGRFAFALGNLIAVTLAVAIAFFLARFLTVLPNSHLIVAGLVFVMAIVIYFDLLAVKPPKRIVKGAQASIISPQRFGKLVVLGFFMTFTTMLDDMFALAPLFLDGFQASMAALVGIYLASLTLIIGTIYFAEKITRVPHKREIATVTLIVFGFLLLFQVV